jgi:hypothetical protein
MRGDFTCNEFTQVTTLFDGTFCKKRGFAYKKATNMFQQMVLDIISKCTMCC